MLLQARNDAATVQRVTKGSDYVQESAGGETQIPVAGKSRRNFN
jgi:hypothetical protein